MTRMASRREPRTGRIGRMVVVLPASGRGIDTARYAAERAARADAGVLVAVTVPNPYVLYGWAPCVPVPEFQYEFVLDMMVQLTIALDAVGAPWDLLPIRSARADLPGALRAAATADLFVHTDGGRRSWSPRALRDRRTAAALARHTTADVWLVRGGLTTDAELVRKTTR